MNEPKPVTICATCRRTLDIRTTPEGGEYRHNMQDPDNHPVVPVSSDPQWRGRCDFCNDDASEYLLPARDFTLPGLGGHGSHGAWSACTPCATLIDANKWDDVLRRAVAGHERTSGRTLDPGTTAALSTLYRVLRANITGPLIELPRPEETP